MRNPLPRSALSGLVFPAVPAQYGCMLLATLYQLQLSEQASRDDLSRSQARQLKNVLAHAQRTVPYYRRLFDAHGIGIPAEVSPEFMLRIPISSRSMMQQAGDDLRSTALPAEHGTTFPITTSGSTGTPVKLTGTGVTGFLWHAFALRDHLWHERDFARKLGAIQWKPRDVARPPDGQPAPTWGNPVDLLFESAPSCILNVATPVREQVEWLRRAQPAYLLAYPSNLAALAAYCIARRVPITELAEVLTVGEMLTVQQRALMKEAWGCKVTDIYSCQEAGYLALQCPSRAHFHVQSENVYLEIVDDDGRPCAPGTAGHVVITTLHNFATPLIRYELGDVAEFGASCPCGRSLPVITRVYGRKRNRLVLPDGRSEFPYLGEHGDILKATGVSVRQFQVIQHSVEEIEVKLVCDRQFTPEETATVMRMTQANFGHPFRVTITYWDDIPKSPREKFEEFVSKVAS